MPRIEKNAAAESDLKGILLFLGRSSTRVMERFRKAAERASQLLAEMPELGGICESDHPRLAGCRLWSIKGFRKYLILYRPLEDGIEILRVFHGSRDLESMFGD